MIGQRGRKKAQPSQYPDTETRDDDKKVRCRLCLQYNSFDYSHGPTAGWISLDSFKRSHLKSEKHLRSIASKKQADDTEDRARQNAPGYFAQSNTVSIETGPPQRLESNPSTIHVPTEMDELMRHFDGKFELDPGREEILRSGMAGFEREAQQCSEWGSTGAAVFNIGPDELEDLESQEDQDILLSELLKNINLKKSQQDATANSPDWAPYPSKTIFLLDLVDNLPRNRISGGLMKVFLWLLSELDVEGVPSFERLREVQKSLRTERGIRTVEWKTPKGQTFLFNDLRTLISNDWSNPLVRPHIRRYPVIPKDGVVSEIWHAQKWRQDIDRTCLSPMYDAGGEEHFYIDEPALCADGRIVIPIRWLEDEMGEVWCEAWLVEVDATGCASIEDGNIVTLKASELQKNFLTLQDESCLPLWSAGTIAKGLTQRMPNPDRILAGGDAIYSSFIDIFGDDVSGNRSKSWNKHWNIYMNHRNLPQKLLFQQYHTHFVSTSTHAPVPEQFEGIKTVIDATHHTPVETRDALTGRPIKIKIYCNCAPGDNPSQSETSGHIGVNGNFPCCKCQVGGSQIEKESESGFHQMFTPGNPRSADRTLAMIEKQIGSACSGVAQTVKDMQTDSGIKDGYTQHWIENLIDRSRNLQRTEPNRALEDIRRDLLKWVSENRSAIINPFLLVKGFDAPMDTPVELLHTILLGVVKYVWHGSHTSWNKKQKAVYSQRLQGTSLLSLSVPNIRSKYIMQYANSLVGRQLKILAQVNSFHVYDLVDDLRFKLTKAIGELSALLWIVEIRNLDEYLADVDTTAANVLDIAAELDPTKRISKIKYHLLTHLREDILRFGPLVGVATETFEAYQLAAQETIKHTLSGGWWLSSKTGTWQQAGLQVRKYIKHQPAIQKLLGWTVDDWVIPAGTITLKAVDREKSMSRNREILAWKETEGNLAVNTPSSVQTRGNDSLMWYRGKLVIAQSQDKCKVGSWIYAESPFSSAAQKEPPITGKIIDILQDSEKLISLVIIDVFMISSTRDTLFDVPVLKRRLDEQYVLAINAEAIHFSYNVQHNCKLAGCTASGERFIRQERVETSNTEAFIEHQPVEQYLINIHALHNAHRLREILPRDLIKPIPYVDDRISHHNTISARLRLAQDSKRVAAAAKKLEIAEKAGNGGSENSESAGKGKKRQRVDEEEEGNDFDINDYTMDESPL